MKLRTTLLMVMAWLSVTCSAQDTFSIVAVDSATGEVGSAGASCIDLTGFSTPADFLGDLLPGKGAINTQASYLPENQTSARQKMLDGDNPQQIIDWLINNDWNGDAGIRQYGVVALVNGHPVVAAHTGASCLDYKGHITGINYSIQGNILLGKQVLDSMEQHFLSKSGTLADKLMYAMQGAKVPGADTRCAGNNTSSLFAFLKVSKPGDAYGSPYLNLKVKTQDNAGKEPVDSLQKLYDKWKQTVGVKKAGPSPSVSVYPNPAANKLEIHAGALEIHALAVTDLVGKTMLVRQEDTIPGSLDVSLLEPGVYILSLEDKQCRSYRVKFIKQ